MAELTIGPAYHAGAPSHLAGSRRAIAAGAILTVGGASAVTILALSILLRLPVYTIPVAGGGVATFAFNFALWLKRGQKHEAAKERVSRELVGQNRQWLYAAKERSVVPTHLADKLVDPDVPLSELFQKKKQLGAGDFGEVALWTSRADGRQFAIKEFSHPETRVEEAIKEFGIGRSLDHPNIVQVYNLVLKKTDRGIVPYMIMECVDGSIGRDVPQRSLSPAVADDLRRQIRSALDHMRQRQIEPRDVNVRNFMITAGSVPMWKFIDVGLYTTEEESKQSNDPTLSTNPRQDVLSITEQYLSSRTRS